VQAGAEAVSGVDVNDGQAGSGEFFCFGLRGAARGDISEPELSQVVLDVLGDGLPIDADAERKDGRGVDDFFHTGDVRGGEHVGCADKVDFPHAPAVVGAGADQARGVDDGFASLWRRPRCCLP